MVTTLELQRRGLRYAVSVDAAATNASLLDLQQKGLPYAVEVADGATMASRAALDARGLRYFVPVASGITAANRAALDRQGLRYAVQVDAAIPAWDPSPAVLTLAVLEQQGLRYFVKVDSSGNSVAAGAAGGAALLTGETNGFATDFTHPVDAERVAVKTANVVVPSGLDAFYSNAGTSPKLVYNAAGTLVWSPHNVVLQSENLLTSWSFTGGAATTATFFRPDTGNTAHRTQANSAAAVVGDTYTHSAIVSAGGYSKIGIIDAQTPTTDVAFDLSAGTKLYQAAAGSGTITALGGGQYLVTNTVTLTAAAARFYIHVLPDSYTTGVVTGAWVPDGVKGINIFRQQTNRGTVPTAYLVTTTAARIGLAVDYDPVTHVAKGLLVEPAATNLLLNSATLSTQNVTVTAVAHVLSFWGTGTVALSGVSTAGPLVGTGASNRVSLAFTPTAGSLTLTVSGTVTSAQLEVGSAGATSWIPTFAATQARAGDDISFQLATIPALGTEWSIYQRFSMPITPANRYPMALANAGGTDSCGLQAQSVGTRLDATVASVNQGSCLGVAAVANVPQSSAGRFKANDYAISVAGGAIVADTTGTLPTVTQAKHGGNPNTGALTITNVLKTMIVPRGWSNAELPVKSAVT